MFDKATRLKLRFESDRGALSVEDLWDLPLTGRVSLDGIALKLHRQLKEQSGVPTSFVTPPPKDGDSGDDLQLKFDVVKTILDVKVKERDDAKMESDRAHKKQQLLEILARKQNSELEGKTTEELTAMINAL